VTEPVVIEAAGLSKRFAGVAAVTNLDLVVRQGEVVGLLGPNGAGKTTTLRMLVGLVLPTTGAVRLFGDVVRPGTAILRRVGVLVEGPAFVPHLSGLENLRLYWRAGRQPLADAHLDEALATARLGEAIHRRVKTYSHGMRQRLGLAQALLGRPELVVLDEPTNGLDPAQMRETREIIRGIAGRGATVLLSSHLLTEVEQVCSHVAVLDRGRLVAGGRVADVVGASRVVYLEVDQPDRARPVLTELAGVTAVTDEPPGLSVQLDGVDRAEVVAALVHAGVGVHTVMSRHRLEDAFLQLVSGEPM
jgi:ABC-2 type transport system ATP-binding protein